MKFRSNEVKKAYRQIEHRYRSLVENSFFGLFIVDIPTGRLLFTNKRLCELFGYSEEEWVDLTVWDLIHPNEHKSIEKTLQKWPEDYENAPARSGIFTGVKKDGSIIRIEIDAAMVAYDEELSIQGLVNDVTRREDFDLIITDMTMPGITGAKLVKSIRNIRPDIPVIICTGYSENINEEKAMNMGINEFILKPLVTRELACKIRRVLDEHSSKKKARNIRYTYLPSA